MCLAESIQYAKRRKAFGKPLLDQPVVRHKLGKMIKMVESTHAWIESLAYRGVLAEKEGRDPFEMMMTMGAEAGFVKIHATETFEFCAREAALLHGGNSYVTGNRIEHLYRQVISLLIPGGSPDPVMDSGVRMSLQSKF